MATIKTVIDELNTIATAFSSVNTFVFDELSSINDDISKNYPVILVNSRSVDYTLNEFNNSYLPNKKSVTLQIFFFDTYKEAQQATTDKQTKYAALELIADQFLAEVKRRTINNYLGFDLVTGSNGFEVDKVHNDNLVQISYNVTFTLQNICTTGTFSY